MWHTYGMTETASAIWLQNREGGTLLSHAQLKIGEEGEIYVRGASLFSGYLGAPHPPGEWFATGDIGAFDAGRLTLIGRKDRRFTSGGEKIYPERIEAALCALPEIEAAAVVPYPDPEFGMRPAACILWRKPPLSLSALKERLTPLLPRYQHPTLLLTLPALPLLPSGKIDYQKISPIVADFLRSQSLSL
jgi:O-succinylbenzoic acid--CoA ligase